MKETALMTIAGPDGPPSLESAAATLGVAVGDMDATFGVVLIDPARRLYAVQVDAARLPKELPDSVSGPFSNPRIEPFSPGKTSKGG